MSTDNLTIDNAFKGVRLKHFPRGQIILFQGDKPFEVMQLKAGIIKIYDIDEDGNEKILHLLKAGAILPLVFFSGNNERVNWFYAALTDCDVCVITYENLNKQMNDSSQLSILLVHWFSIEVHELLVRMSSLGKTNTRGKILAALKFLAVHHAIQRRSGWWRVTFPVNHQLLADMTGMTRESAAMIMKEIKDEKIIRQPRVTILEINTDKLFLI